MADSLHRRMSLLAWTKPLTFAYVIFKIHLRYAAEVETSILFSLSRFSPKIEKYFAYLRLNIGDISFRKLIDATPR